MKNEQNIEDLHFEHKLWQSEANFYQDELKIYQKQVEEVGKRNSSPSVKEKVTYFEDKFKLKNEKLQSLIKEITDHEHCLADIEKNESDKAGGGNSIEHAEMRKKFVEFKEKYSKLKSEFMLFLEDQM
jgi:hypothetical protein